MIDSRALTPNRVSHYVTTVENNAEGLETIKRIREEAKKLSLKYCGVNYNVVLRGRLGKDNPAAVFYRRSTRGILQSYLNANPAQMILNRHAATFDLYVYPYLQKLKGIPNWDKIREAQAKIAIQLRTSEYKKLVAKEFESFF